ncbi:PKD domain-containing protein [Cytophagales bacterium LB-30]|uniref:PKD domain-containing protein n=1 Tax=Shiella aurantiaca TaxID=3058365 RepID=A0ABT8F9A5_9BACT|nr:PKD-like domain-containing protein [Shiella aurantiaca]MDN4166878.1 PKD domain-containing protein [Shiella aurantiaca]
MTSNDPDGAGPCAQVQDQVIITIDTEPTVYAGGNQIICEGSDVTLTAATANLAAGTVTWSSSGTGAFDNNNLVQATYTPSLDDVANGSVVLTIESSDPAGPCVLVSSAATITINPNPVVNAGSDFTSCQSTDIALSGTVSGGANTGSWFLISGTGALTASSTTSGTVTATYTPGLGDDGNTVSFELRSTDPLGPCTVVIDDLNVLINQDAVVDAGPSTLTICEGDDVSLSAVLSGAATSLTWTTSDGTGSFDNATDPNTFYSPSAGDISAGSIILRATTNDPDAGGPCVSTFDEIVVTITRAPVVSVMADFTACETDVVLLTGNISGNPVTVGTWEVISGNGILQNAVGNFGAASVEYVPDAADANTSVEIRLVSNDIDGAGPCAVAADTVVIYINEAAQVDAGAATLTICEGDVVSLSASIAGTTSTITWTSDSGHAGFADASLLNTTYTPSATDISNGSVKLYITTNDPDVAGPCLAVSDSITVTINRISTVDAGLDFDACQTDVVNVSGTIGGNGATTASWEIITGAGSLQNEATVSNTVSVEYVPDISDANTQVELRLVTNDIDGGGPCQVQADTVLITINEAAFVSAGTDQTICEDEDVSLAGSFSGAATSIIWTSPTGGTFDDNTSISAIYTPSATDISNGSVTLTIETDDPDAAGPCQVVSDQVVITINQKPRVDAASSAAVICQGENIALTGTTSGSTSTISWTAIPGDGTFSNSSSLTPNYTPGAADIANGSVKFKIFSTDTDGAGPCIVAVDSVEVTINPAPFVDAGANQTVCETDLVNLSGTISGSATLGTWSIVLGDGSLSASNTSAGNVTATYTPASTDVGNVVRLRLTTDDPDAGGPCGTVLDEIVLTVNEAATADAGTPSDYCQTDVISLSGTIGGSASSGTWTITSGTGTLGASTTTGTTVTASYTPGASDAGNTVILRLTTNDPDASGPCSVVFSEVTHNIFLAPTVSAGSNATICEGQTVSLSGTSGGSTSSVTWTAVPGGGAFGDATSLSTTYQPSPADIANGSVLFTLSSDDPTGPCSIVTSTKTVTINQAAIVDAGVSQIVCEGDVVSLAGSISGSASSATWSSSMGGTFSNPASLTSTYAPSATDISAGTVTLALTTNDPDGSGPCAAVMDQVTIQINQAATVNAGSNQLTCENAPFEVTGTIGGSATSGTWSIVSGNGTLSASSVVSTNVSATYTPTVSDAGTTVVLRLTTNDPDGADACTVKSDDMNLQIEREPIVSAGTDAAICAYDTYSLSGKSSANYYSSLAWTTSGDGTFSNANALAPTYTPGTNDIANGSVVLSLEAFGLNACASNTASMTLTVKPIPVINDPADIYLCPGESITPPAFSASLSGGTFSWSITTSSLTIGATSGTGNMPLVTANANSDGVNKTSTVTINYTLNGCLAASETFSIIVKPKPVTTAVSDIIVCPGETVEALFNSNVSGATFNWTNTNTNIGLPASGSGNISYTAPENLTGSSFVGTITFNASANSCVSDNRTFRITVRPRPVMNPVSEIVVCPGEPITTFFTSNVTGAGFTWSNDNTLTGIAASGNGNLNFVAASNSTTSDRVSTITVYGSRDGCEGDAIQFNVRVKPRPVLTAPSSISVCPGEVVPEKIFTDNFSGETTFNWSVINASAVGLSSASGTGSVPSFTANANNTGNPIQAVVTVTSSLNGCTSVAANYTITVKPTPIITNSSIPSIAVCAGDSYSYNFGSNVTGTTYSWTNSNPAIGLAASGTGNISFTGSVNTTGADIVATIVLSPVANGCAGPDKEFTITLKATPVIETVINQSYCPEEDVLVDFIANTTGETFTWSNSNPAIGLAATGTGDISFKATANTSGSDIVSTITYSATRNGCISEVKNFTITIKHQPVVNAVADLSNCSGTAVSIIDLSDNTGLGIISWSATNSAEIGLSAASGTGDIPAFTLAENTTGSAITSTITFTSEVNGCISLPESFDITVYPTPVLTNTDVVLCNGETANILFEQNTSGTHTYTWTNSNTAVGLFNPSGSGQLPPFNAVNTGTSDIISQISVEATSPDGCVSQLSSFNIVVKPNPRITNSALQLNQTICSGDLVSLVPTSNLSGIRFEWVLTEPGTNVTHTATSGEGEISDVVENLTNQQQTLIYTITPITEEGAICTGESEELLVFVKPKPTLTLGATEYFVCSGNAQSIDLSNPNVVSGTSYEWTVSANNSQANAGSGSVLNPTLINTDIQVDTLTYTINAVANDCRSESQEVTVYVYPDVFVSVEPDFVVCEGEDIILRGTASGNVNGVFWEKVGAGGNFINQFSNEAIYKMVPSDYGRTIEFRFTATDPDRNGPCVNKTQSVFVTINTRTALSFQNTETNLCVTSNDDVLLSAFPAGGEFSGTGVYLSVDDNRYYFSPATADLGTHVVNYSFTNASGCTSEVSKEFEVSTGPVATFNIAGYDLDEEVILCKNQSRVILNPVVEGGTFSQIAGITTTGSETTFDPSSLASGTYQVTYSISQNNSCTDQFTRTIKVLPAPELTIEPLDLCDNRVRFTALVNGLIAPDEVLEDEDYSWTVSKDGITVTGIGREYVHEFNQSAGLYTITLFVHTSLGCTFSKEFNGGFTVNSVTTKPDFSLSGICQNEATSFTDASQFKFGNAVSWTWDFGDPSSADNTSNLQNPSHVFSSFGAYQVKLLVSSDKGCTQEISKTVNILPSISPTAQSPYLQNFENGEAGWYADYDRTRQNRPSTWEFGTPEGEVINAAKSGIKAWVTSLEGKYPANERSYVVGPCFDLSQLQKPMLSLALWSDVARQSDGAVIQYSFDLENWTLLGDMGRGLGWYNQENIVSNPQALEAIVGNVGWSNTSDGWYTASYALDELKALGDKVTFRVVFASDGSSFSDGEGFAFDDFYVGERNKNLLIEHFTNFNASNYSRSAEFSDVLSNPVLAQDVINLQYHTSFPQKDSISARGSVDSDTRALNYGLSEVPALVANGRLIEATSEQAIIDTLVALSLEVPQVLINLSYDASSPATIVAAAATIQPFTPIEEPLDVYFGVVENEVNLSNGESIKGLLRRLAPDPTGLRIEHLLQAQEFTMAWDIESVYDVSNLGIVCFVVNSRTKEVLQSAFVPVSGNKVAPVISGVDDLIRHAGAIQLYPNPASQEVAIRFDQALNDNISYQLVDSRGATVSQGVLAGGQSQFSLDVSAYRQGVYFIHLKSASGTSTHLKFMITR